MSEVPARPPTVPDNARYHPDLDGWEVSELDALGRRSGPCTVYRGSDGSVYLQTHYVDGVQEGAFTLFHKNGQPARRGRYSNGILDGDVFSFACDEPSTEFALRACCVPSGAWELRQRFSNGELVREIFYDRDGWPLAPDGTRWPTRPRSVPESAVYDDLARSWMARDSLGGSKWRLRAFRLDGSLAEELEYAGSVQTCIRHFDARSAIVEERPFDPEGRLHGVRSRWFSESHPNPYSDARVRAERGQFWHGQPVGTFAWMDADGETLSCWNLGVGVTEELLAASPAFSDAVIGWSAEQLVELAQELRSKGHTREALCAAARAAVREHRSDRLSAMLTTTTLVLRPELAAERGHSLLQTNAATLMTTLDELLLGAEPASVFRALAGLWRGSRHTALEFADAACLLAPDRGDVHVTRALLRLEVGDTAGALEDAARIERDSAVVADHLRTSARVTFPEFTFWPAREALDPEPEDCEPLAVVQPLDKVRHQIAVYATRLTRLLEAILATAPPSAPWTRSLPDLRELLPNGPVELRRWEATLTEQTEDGMETVELTIDETLDLAGQPLTSLMRQARAMWAGLCWLCWSVGLEAVQLPTGIAERPALTAAVNTFIPRLFRARDQLQSNGLISRARGVPGFQWEGMDVSDLDAGFVATAIAEYTEIRCVLFWLIFSENLSPFQSDIRSA